MRNNRGTSNNVPLSSSSPVAVKPEKDGRLVKLVLLSTAICLGIWGMLHHPLYEEFRLSRLTLPQFQNELKSHSDDPAFLYHLGRKLNQSERFVEADPFLRKAVGISPENPAYRDEWAKALLGSGLTTAAYGQLREFAGKNENLAESHLILGKFYVTQNSMKRAKEELVKTVKLNSTLGEAWALLCTSENSLGNEQASREAAKKAVELRPANAGDRLIYARFLLRANQIQVARKEYEEALRLAPNQWDAHRDYAEFLLTYGDAKDVPIALKEAKAAVEANKTDASSQLTLGRALIKSGSISDAVEPLKRAADLSKDESSPALELTQTYRSLGQSKEAEEWNHSYLKRKKFEQDRSALWESLRVSPENADLHRKLATLLGKHGDTEGCIRQFASAMRCAVDAPTALIPAANALTEGGFATQALPLAQRAVAVASANPKAHEALGNALLGTGQLHQAGLEYDKTVGWEPERRDFLKKKLEAYSAERANKPSPAEQVYRDAKKMAQEQVGPRQMTPEVEALAKRAVELEPNNPTYVWFLMEVQIAQKRKEEAILSARNLLRLVPRDSRGNALLGLLLAEKANTPAEYQEASKYLKQVATDPLVKATYHYGLGVLALRQNQGENAVRELKLAVQLDPKSDVGLYQLALAQRLAGDVPGSALTMVAYAKRQESKRLLSEALGNIAQHPDDLQLYEKAAKLYERSDLQDQAKAIRQAGFDRSHNK